MAPCGGLGLDIEGDAMSYSCDVTMRFSNGQPAKTVFIGHDRKARDKEHAIELAKLDTGAKGWDMRRCDSIETTGPYML